MKTLCVFVCVCAWMKPQNRLLACVRYSMCTKDIISLCANCLNTGRGCWVHRQTCEKAYNARWYVQMCRFANYKVSMTLELYRRMKNSHNNGHFLTHEQMPTQTWVTSLVVQQPAHWYLMKSMHFWPVTMSVRCGVLCVCLRWLDWLLTPWCVVRLCSHSYCIYGGVSAHLTHHAHSRSHLLCLVCLGHIIISLTQVCYSVILFFCY